MNKLVKTKELYASWPEYLAELFEGSEYPWEMLPKLKGYIQALIEREFRDTPCMRKVCWWVKM